VADDHRLLLAQHLHQPHDVPGELEDVVSLDRLRAVGAAIAALVGGDGVEPGRGQGRQLMPPGVPELGETVAEDDERALALLGEVHGDAVGSDGSMLDLGHGHSRKG
jgi:hypothetical protein